MVLNGLVQGKVVQSNPYLSVALTIHKETVLLNTQLVGDYNLPNILCAVAVGVHFKISLANIKQAIEAYTPTNSRSQLITKDSNHYILDAYNANPSSMKVAIENFAQIQASQKVVMLGAMMELGNASVQEHQNIVNLLAQYNWHKVVLTGGDFAFVKHNYIYMKDAADAGEWLKQHNFTNTYFLIKGSRSIQMEKVLI